jgi:hypothetical protein
MISTFSCLVFIAKCIFLALKPLIFYMDNPSFISPCPSPSGNLTMAQLILTSPDPNLASSSDSITTTKYVSSVSARISAAVLHLYMAQTPFPVTNIITFTDACVSRIESTYPSDIS